MFQCLSGRKMHEKAFYSPFYSQEGQNGLVDLRARTSPQVKNTQAIKINVSLLNYHPGSARVPQLIPIRICGRGVQQAQEHATLGKWL